MLRAPHPLTGRRPGVVSLVLSNGVPLVGVVWFGWSLWEVMYLYWLENAVIGAYAVGRIVLAAGGDDSVNRRCGVAAFFWVHYGGFWLGHGVFLSIAFGAADLNARAVGVGVLSMVASHGVSFVMNYLRRERQAAVAGIEMFKPYGRVVLLHIVILVGGFIVEAGGEPWWALALLVTMKTALDLTVHVVGHRMREGTLQVAPAARHGDAGWPRD